MSGHMSNDFYDSLNKILDAVRKNQHHGKTDEEYHQWISIVGQYLPNTNGGGKAEAEFAILRIKDAIAKNQTDRELAELRKQHEATIGKSGAIEGALISLKMPHKLHWWLLWVAIMTAIFAGIAAWPVIREWLPASQPANKSASSPPPQSNSTPASITATQKLPIAPGGAQGTNHP
jgi:hypothetical protein